MFIPSGTLKTSRSYIPTIVDDGYIIFLRSK